MRLNFSGLDLTPALSSWRGRTIHCPLEIPATALAGHAHAKPMPRARCSFSQGEKVRMRAIPKEFRLTPFPQSPACILAPKS
jgi:hypothetical protein